MKIRQGFVSNSSSSSFVVAFPSQPNNADEVMEMLFPAGPKNRILSCYEEFATYGRIAERVWQDVENQVNRTPEEDLEAWSEWEDTLKEPLSDLEKISKSFEGRYHYLTGTSVDIGLLYQGTIKHVSNCQSDPKEFFGISEDQLKEAASWELETDSLWKEERNEAEELRSKLGLVDPPYNRKASEEEDKKRDNICEENREKLWGSKEGTALRDEFSKKKEHAYRMHKEAVKKLAQTDAEAFFNSHKDAFFLFTSYSDDCESLMEHGDIFKRLPHVRISQH